jgi:lysophospholipase L1-like esterase
VKKKEKTYSGMEILFLGDSLIEYFDWQERFPGHAVSNQGISGEPVEGLLSRLPGIIRKHPSADLIFIMTGINNIAMGDLDILDTYRAILGKLKTAYPDAGICVNSLLPAIVDFIPDDSIQRINSSLKKVAGESGDEYLNVYSLFVDEKGHPIKDYLLDDGVHLSDRGYAVWSGTFEPIIKKITLETGGG